MTTNAQEWLNPPVSQSPAPAGESAPPVGMSENDWLGIEGFSTGAVLTGVCLKLPPAAAGAWAVVSLGVGLGFLVYGILKEHHICILGIAGDCNVHIDPSGTVLDQNGAPVNGTKVTLLDQTVGGAPFAPVATGTGAIEPDENPETTGAPGEFDWEALAGTYEVQASASGCHAPHASGEPSVFTSPFVIPPPAVGLVPRTLLCAGRQLTKAPSLKLALEPNGSGWIYRHDKRLHREAGPRPPAS